MKFTLKNYYLKKFYKNFTKNFYIYKIVFNDTLKIIKESNVFYCYKNFLDWIISNESVYILKF